jgi:hypothetical protein
VNRVSCIRFEKETIGEVQPVQIAKAPCKNAEVPRQNVEVSGSGRTVAPTRPRHNLDHGSKLLKKLTLVYRSRRIQLYPRGTSMLTNLRPMHPMRACPLAMC